ncbi:MAG: radical SAM protein [Candidatus Aminicenantes bacterium]
MKKSTRRQFLQNSLVLTGMTAVFPKTGKVERMDKMTNSGSSANKYPSYLNLVENGELHRRAEELYAHYENCTLCPRDCRVDRTRGEKGKCEAPAELKISSAFPHFGEESPLVGKKGSGTIFFSHCGLRCVYCQNFSISIEGGGMVVSEGRVAESMLKLQGMGCHNINLVTPTHYLPGIIRALETAAAKGLNIPLVYNTGGFEDPKILKLLDGIVDIYLPDFKYTDSAHAAEYSSEAYSYPYYVKEAFREMFRQVGNLETNRYAIARRGLMIRHLVLPNNVSGTREMLKFVAEELSTDCYINIMRQYRPEYKAGEYPKIDRRIKSSEYAEAVNAAKEMGFTRLA